MVPARRHWRRHRQLDARHELLASKRLQHGGMSAKTLRDFQAVAAFQIAAATRYREHARVGAQFFQFGNYIRTVPVGPLTGGSPERD